MWHMWLQLFAKGWLKKNIVSVHEGKKPFKCDICDYRCSQKVNMNRHVASVHEEKKPFKCEICDATFTQKSSLKTHMTNIHQEKTS